VILGVSFDSQEANGAFKEKFGFPYDLLSDTGGAMSQAYGAAEPGAAVASRVSVLIGPDGNVAKAYATVKPADHPDEVLADLSALS